MGFLSTLGKIGKVALKAAPFVAAPFTGGASLGLGALGAGGAAAGAGGVLGALGKIGQVAGKVGKVASAIGPVAGAAAAGAAGGRREDALIRNQLTRGNNRDALDAAEFNVRSPGVRASQVARGDVLSTMRDAAPTGDPRIDKFGGGGLRPSAFGDRSRAAGDELASQAMEGLQGGDRITPERSQLEGSGLLEKIGGGIGLAGGLAGALQQGGGMPQVAQMPQPGPAQTSGTANLSLTDLPGAVPSDRAQGILADLRNTSRLPPVPAAAQGSGQPGLAGVLADLTNSAQVPDMPAAQGPDIRQSPVFQRILADLKNTSRVGSRRR